MPTEEEQFEERGVEEVLAESSNLLREVEEQIPALPQNKVHLKKLVEDFSDSRSELVRRVIPDSLSFGADYAGGLNHDLVPPGNVLWMGVRVEQAPKEGLRAVVRTIRHLLNSVRGEFFKIDYSPVGLNMLASKIIAYFKNIDLVLGVPEEERGKIELTSFLEPEGWVALTQEDILFRIIYNLVTNSQRSISSKYDKFGRGGKIDLSATEEGNSIWLHTKDNGAGFGDFFREINLATQEEKIPLPVVIERANGVSCFREIGIGGTGKGLGICQHLAELIGAEIFISNPKVTDGACVSIKLPKAR